MSHRSEATRKCNVLKYLHRVVHVFVYLEGTGNCTQCSKPIPFMAFIAVVLGPCSPMATTMDRSKTGRGF